MSLRDCPLNLASAYTNLRARHPMAVSRVDPGGSGDRLQLLLVELMKDDECDTSRAASLCSCRTTAMSAAIMAT